MTGAADCVLVVDGGTTNTRVFAVAADGRILASARAALGARDGARPEGRAELARVVDGLVTEAARGLRPSMLVAAGMITSPQGLVEVPHVRAPAGPAELAAGAHLAELAAELQALFLPGVRFGPDVCTADTVASADVVRGEEVLGIGLARRGLLPGGGLLVNLGSHWKRMVMDAAGCVVESKSCLSGEVMAAVTGHTILAGAVSEDLGAALDPEWVAAGAAEVERTGLGRALYCVRLLALRSTSTPAERLAYLTGAILRTDGPTLLAGPPTRCLVVGRPDLATSFCRFAAERGFDARPLDEEAARDAFIAGCLAALQAWHAGNPAI